MTKEIKANEFILTKPEDFHTTILNLDKDFDAIICAHNLEHCNDRWSTLHAMCKKLKKKASLYLSFPSEKTIHLPSRKGSLNYYDDSTHKDIPPNFDKCISIIKENGLTIKYSIRRYRPIFLSLVGFILEPYSIVKKQVTFGTWEYYGFESIIWAIKK